MIYGYYPGCCLRSTCKDFDTSMRAVLGALGIELEEVKRWTCCGSSSTHAASRRLAVALPLRNLAKAEEQGFEEVFVPCAACFARFKFAWHEIQGDAKLRREMEDVLRHRFTDRLKIVHPLELFNADDMLKRIASSRKRDISALKVVCYYGCLLSRPPDHFDDAEYPQTMDRALRAAGASVLDWGCRTDCCGASLSLTRTDIVLKLSHDILEGAKEAGADAIAVTCPFCHLNLDARQSAIEKEYGTKYEMPIYFYSQIMAVALGLPEKKLMLHMHFVHPRALLEKAESGGN